MAEKKVQLSKKDRLSVALRSTFLQGSWNYERMQDRKSTRLNSSHITRSRMPSSA